MPGNRLRRVINRVRTASRRYDSGPLAVARRALALRARAVGMEEAYLSGALDPRVSLERCADFVGRRNFLAVLRPFNAGPKELVDDKVVFAAHAHAHGLAAPRTLAVVSPPLATEPTGRPLHAADDWESWLRDAPRRFVIKPAVGMGGLRVDFFERDIDGTVRAGGRTYSAADLRRRVCLEGAFGRALVQERLTNHSSLAELSGTAALQCTRMVTVVARAGGVELLFAFQKLIVGDNLIDNSVGTSTGNLVVSVESADGVLGVAFADGAPCARHPTTARTIAGVRLPWWDEARALVERAALCFRPLRAIGWDVALTERGPVLVEGNTEWVAFAGERGFWYSAADLVRLQNLY